MSVLRVAFTVHNLSTGDENDYGLHIELGLARNPLKDVVALRLEGNCNIKYSLKLKRSIVSARGQKFPFFFCEEGREEDVFKYHF